MMVWLIIHTILLQMSAYGKTRKYNYILMYWTQELLLLQQNNNEKFIQIKTTMRLIFLHFWHYTLLIFKQETIKHRVYGIFFQMHLQQA